MKVWHFPLFAFIQLRRVQVKSVMEKKDTHIEKHCEAVILIVFIINIGRL